MSGWKKYAYAWITLILFVGSLAAHLTLGWYAYIDDQHEHGQPVEPAKYAVQFGRDVMENWQSEFLQLLWQVGGLAAFLYVGSPQSKEGEDRMEEKLDAILRRLDPNGEKLIASLDKRFPRR